MAFSCNYFKKLNRYPEIIKEELNVIPAKLVPAKAGSRNPVFL
jgi:hypothetical protein